MSWFSKFNKAHSLSVLKAHLSISRQTILSGPSGCNYVKQNLDNIMRLALAGNRRPLITLTLSGYDADPRELHEIPEVCKWARDLRERLPVLFFFLDWPSQQRYVGWICGPVQRSNVNTPEFRRKFEEYWSQCIGDVMGHAEQYLKGVGASESYIDAVIATDLQRLG